MVINTKAILLKSAQPKLKNVCETLFRIVEISKSSVSQIVTQSYKLESISNSIN